MKNPIMIIALVIVVAFLSIGAFSLSQKSSRSDSMMKKDEVLIPTEGMMKKDEPTMEKTTDEMGAKMSNARYIEYSKAALDTATTTRRVLFFYASWCPTCRPADANFRENESMIPEDVTVIRVHYNDSDTDQEEKDLAKKYGVTYQHTYVQIDGLGTEITKWNGGQLKELLTNSK